METTIYPLHLRDWVPHLQQVAARSVCLEVQFLLGTHCKAVVGMIPGFMGSLETGSPRGHHTRTFLQSMSSKRQASCLHAIFARAIASANGLGSFEALNHHGLLDPKIPY